MNTLIAVVASCMLNYNIDREMMVCRPASFVEEVWRSKTRYEKRH